MRRRFAFTLGALALGWMAGSATAADPKPMPEQITVSPAPSATSTTSGQVMYEGSAPMVGGYGEGDNGEGKGHLTAGAGIYVLKPYPAKDTAFVSKSLTTGGTSGAGSFSSETTDFDHKFEVSPLVWLGYISDSGMGARIRWWHFDTKSTLDDSGPGLTNNSDGSVTRDWTASAEPFGHSGIASDPFSTKDNDSLTFEREIRLNVIDLEGIHEFKWGCMTGLVTSGIRFAQLRQTYDASRQGKTDPNGFDSTGLPVIDEDSISASHRFNGVGPTFSLEIRRPLGDSGLALYSNMRTSILFGKNKFQTDKDHQFQCCPDETLEQFTVSHTEEHDQVIPVLELELGAEWSKCMGSFTPFVRVAGVAQSWIDAGSATSDTGNLGFSGFTVQAGINY